MQSAVSFQNDGKNTFINLIETQDVSQMKNTETELTFLSLLLYKEPEEKQRGRVTYNLCVINLSEDLQMEKTTGSQTARYHSY